MVMAVGPNFTTRHNPRTIMTSPPDLHQKLARTLIAAMKDSAPAARLIAVSTASMGPADNVMGTAPPVITTGAGRKPRRAVPRDQEITAR